MPVVELKQVDGIAYREAVPAGDPSGDPVLCVHGFPESSYMWRDLLTAVAEAGRVAVAPDLIGFGDTPPDPPGTWERQIEHVERFRRALGLERVFLVVHDWGGFIGLRWACDNPEAVGGLVISDAGFFPDGRWHGMAKALRTPDQGEEVVEGLTREGLRAVLPTMSKGFDDQAADEYYKAFATEEGRRGALELYRSGDMEKLIPYEGRLGALGVPTLLLWGENDDFAPIGGAYRFRKQIPGAELVVVEGAGHFVYADEPERCAEEVVRFLGQGAQDASGAGGSSSVVGSPKK